MMMIENAEKKEFFFLYKESYYYYYYYYHIEAIKRCKGLRNIKDPTGFFFWQPRRDF